MLQIYQRFIKGVKVRLGQYSDFDFAIYVGNRLYASIDNMADAYREYNAVNEDTVNYLGL